MDPQEYYVQQSAITDTEAGDTAFDYARGIYEGEESPRVPPAVNRRSPAAGLQSVDLVA